jgi:hypothetical protein
LTSYVDFCGARFTLTKDFLTKAHRLAESKIAALDADNSEKPKWQVWQKQLATLSEVTEMFSLIYQYESKQRLPSIIKQSECSAASLLKGDLIGETCDLTVCGYEVYNFDLGGRKQRGLRRNGNAQMPTSDFVAIPYGQYVAAEPKTLKLELLDFVCTLCETLYTNGLCQNPLLFTEGTMGTPDGGMLVPFVLKEEGVPTLAYGPAYLANGYPQKSQSGEGQRLRDDVMPPEEARVLLKGELGYCVVNVAARTAGNPFVFKYNRGDFDRNYSYFSSCDGKPIPQDQAFIPTVAAGVKAANILQGGGFGALPQPPTRSVEGGGGAKKPVQRAVLTVGSKVRLCHMKKHKNLEGCMGEIIKDKHTKTGRWGVRYQLVSGETKEARVSPDNLKSITLGS